MAIHNREDSMRFLFLDESGDTGRGGTPILMLAGIILRAEDWPRLRNRFDQLKSKHGINPNTEVKWRHIRYPSGAHHPLHALSRSDRILFARQALGLVRGTNLARVIGVVIDKVAAYARPDVASAEDLYDRAVTLAMERFQYYLHATGDLGAVVQDQRHFSQDIRLRAFYRTLLRTGTRWTMFPNVVESVFLTPSDFSTGLQLADFIAGAIYTAHFPGRLEPKYFTIIQGKITGDRKTGKRHGFKKWP